MAVVAIQIKVMPSSPDEDIPALREEIQVVLKRAGAIRIEKIEEQEIAFGLKAIIVTVAWPEEKETSEAQTAIESIEGISSTDIIDYRRAFG
jgi:elongation factor 1-beta